MKVTNFYFDCLRKALNETWISYGINSNIQKVNWFLTIIPFLSIAIVGINQKGVFEFFKNIPENLIDLLLGLVWLLVVIIFNLIKAPFLLHYDLQQQVEKLELNIADLERRTKPLLCIEFENMAPFVQHAGSNTLLRIRIKNLSNTESIKNVRVQLNNILPQAKLPLPLTLHQMHDNPPPPVVYREFFDLSPSEPKYIDVITINNQGGSICFYVQHTARNVPTNPIELINSLTIQAFGENTSSVTQNFTIDFEKNRSFLFIPS